MLITVVGSTTLATVAYDEAHELLQLEFCNRAVYQYFGVPAAVHQALLNAPSKGRYFRQAIRGIYSFVRLCVPQVGESHPEVPPQCEHGGTPWHAR